MASSLAKRVLGLLMVTACIGAAAGGVWYVKNGAGVDADAEADEDLEDEVDTVDPKHDGGARGKPKKKPGARRAKGSARAKPAAGGGGPVGPSGMSYEAAIASNNLHLTPGTKDAPDLTDQQLAGPMRNATFLDACGVPSSTKMTVKVAIRNGHAVGVSVYSNPADPQSDGCVERRVRGLYWPSSAKMDSFVTTY